MIPSNGSGIGRRDITLTRNRYFGSGDINELHGLVNGNGIGVGKQYGYGSGKSNGDGCGGGFHYNNIITFFALGDPADFKSAIMWAALFGSQS